MTAAAGRTCPTGYRYGPAALAAAPEQAADTLYVIGGLYGNKPALDAIEAMAARETGRVTLCFNGDFNWFNIDDDGFAEINARVLAHDALLGNVEAELFSPDADSGCGCAYPESVDSRVVERSNAIHARLKTTARRHPVLIERLSRLPMLRRYRVGGQAIGVVHGDAESLAGWLFDVAALDDNKNRDRIADAFRQATVDVFACTHTCLPALRAFVVNGRRRLVINNGAAGMPNFRNASYGLLTRISTRSSRHRQLYGIQCDGTYIDAIPIGYHQDTWLQHFQANWPKGSPAHASYFSRLVDGPNHTIRQAAPRELEGKSESL